MLSFRAGVYCAHFGLLASVASATTWTNDRQVAELYRPRYNFKSNTVCNGLSFKEIATNGSPDLLRSYCRTAYSSDFVVFASVHRLSALTPSTARVSYFLAYGKEQFSSPQSGGEIGELLDSLGLGHDEDVENQIVDIVDGAFTSMRFNVHKGAYARPRGLLATTSDGHPEVYVGQYFHASYHTTDRYDPGLFNNYVADLLTAANLGYVPNFGDFRAAENVGYGKLVLVDEICTTTGTTYTAPDGTIYSGSQLTALKGVAGCGQNDPAITWSNNIREKEMYYDPYSLLGCESGDKSAGDDVCWASAFPSNMSWDTSRWNGTTNESSVIDGAVGDADVDGSRGSLFSDFDVTSLNEPRSITIRTGERVDRVSMVYADGVTRSHGGSGGSATTLSYTNASGQWDPVTKIVLCPASKSGQWRAGRIELTTAAGRGIAGGKSEANSTHPCVTKTWTGSNYLRGFYGRCGSEVDLLGAFSGADN